MTDNNLLNNAIDILLLNGISSIDLNFIRKHISEIFNDDISDDERNLHGVIKATKTGIKYILLYSKSGGWLNLRALWVNPDFRNAKIATRLLSDIRKQSKELEGVLAFVPFNEQRFALSKLLLKNGYQHRRYIASISASEYNSVWKK